VKCCRYGLDAAQPGRGARSDPLAFRKHIVGSAYTQCRQRDSDAAALSSEDFSSLDHVDPRRRYSILFPIVVQVEMIPGTLKNLPGSSWWGTWNTSLHVSPMSRWFELVSGGVKRRVFAAHSRRIPSTKPEVLHVPVLLRLWDSIGGPAQLIIRCAIIRPAMMGRLSEHRRSNGGGKNYHSTLVSSSWSFCFLRFVM